jgi:predicted AAA+ superfamily ATPase
MARELARTDPVLFFQTYKPPVLIDEVQYAPQLFEQIKVLTEAGEETGRFWLTGSQQYNMMKKVVRRLPEESLYLNSTVSRSGKKQEYQ